MKGKKKIILLIGGAVCLLLILFLTSDREEVATLTRPGYGEGDSSQELCAEDEKGNQITLEIPITARTLSGEALSKAFEETYACVCGLLPGENESLQEVREDLVFETAPGEYGIEADYSLADYTLINAYGEVTNDALTEPVECEITLTLMYDELMQTYIIPVTVLPREESDSESLRKAVLNQIEQEDSDDELVQLPTEAGGSSIRFYRNTGTRTALIACLILFAAVFWYYRKRVLPRKAETKREEALMQDYSEVVSKLSILVGAGMSIRNAMIRMEEDYEEGNGGVGSNRNWHGGRKRPAYEEIGRTVRRLQAGMSEEAAYHEYGRACKLRQYLKLSGLLCQSLKKGNERLLSELKAEAEDAFAERKTMAIRAGEKASTRLVFPMILMLGIVFLIIMVPAFLSM